LKITKNKHSFLAMLSSFCCDYAGCKLPYTGVFLNDDCEISLALNIYVNHKAINCDFQLLLRGKY
jgi:hypothetical protein